MKRSKGFTLIELLVVISIIALLIGILLPALGAARRAARQMANTTQVRGIVQGMAAFGASNNGKFPGVDSKGRILEDTTRKTGDSGHGATVEARFWVMLDNNLFSGKYCISPSESKTVWTSAEVEDDNYSYALLNIDDGTGSYTPTGTPATMSRPNQGGRVGEWGAKINSQAPLISDRAKEGISDDHEDIYSIYTSEDDGEWKGSIGWSDARAKFESEATLDTRFGNAPLTELDRLFTYEQDGSDYDIIDTTGGATWDDKSNALLGYTDVGYDGSDVIVN